MPRFTHNFLSEHFKYLQYLLTAPRSKFVKQQPTTWCRRPYEADANHEVFKYSIVINSTFEKHN